MNHARRGLAASTVSRPYLSQSARSRSTPTTPKVDTSTAEPTDPVAAPVTGAPKVPTVGPGAPAVGASGKTQSDTTGLSQFEPIDPQEMRASLDGMKPLGDVLRRRGRGLRRGPPS